MLTNRHFYGGADVKPCVIFSAPAQGHFYPYDGKNHCDQCERKKG